MFRPHPTNPNCRPRAGVAKRRGAPPVRGRGFTLIEALVVVGIVGILAAVAAPQFTDLMRNSRLSAASSALQVSLSLARSEAVKRGADARVTVAAKGAAGVFTNGWTVFVDRPGNGNGGVAPTVDGVNYTRVESVAAPAPPISFGKSAAPNHFTYNGQGRMTSLPVGGSLWFSDAASEKHCLIISNTGRVRVARVASAAACA